MQVRYKLRELEAPAISVQYSNQYPAYLLRKGHSYAEWHDSCKKKPSRKAEKDLDPRDLGMFGNVPWCPFGLEWSIWEWSIWIWESHDSKIHLSAIGKHTGVRAWRLGPCVWNLRRKMLTMPIKRRRPLMDMEPIKMDIRWLNMDLQRMEKNTMHHESRASIYIFHYFPMDMRVDCEWMIYWQLRSAMLVASKTHAPHELQICLPQTRITFDLFAAT